MLAYKGVDTEDGLIIIDLPGSKSIAARALILNQIFDGKFELEGLPDCSDTLELKSALDRLNSSSGDIYNLGEGATSLRFFVAYVASVKNFEGFIDCRGSLRKRPVGTLVDVLNTMGGCVRYSGKDRTFPLKVSGRHLGSFEGKCESNVSSQFVSALMMASLLWDKRYDPEIDKDAVSRPYIEMTRKIIGQFENFNHNTESEHPLVYHIEKDWSAASYFYEYVLLNPDSRLFIPGLKEPSKSLQGDSRCLKIFDEIGINSNFKEIDGIEGLEIKADNSILKKWKTESGIFKINLKDCPDLVPAIVVGLCASDIKFYIDGIAHLRHKESNRIDALAKELIKVGFRLNIGDDFLSWQGEKTDKTDNILFDSYGDHRMAMALAISSVKFGNVYINNTTCVNKSFPNFFQEIKKLGIDLI